MHLTNYSLNKHNPDFIRAGTESTNQVHSTTSIIKEDVVYHHEDEDQVGEDDNVYHPFDDEIDDAHFVCEIS